MPAYNAARFIRQAIESILNQTYSEFELIVVDDGSTDNTVDIVKEYAAKDARVTLIQNSHGGACKARNTGIHRAKYPWIAAMDADDVALPQRFEKQLAAAASSPEVVVWGSYCYQINVDGEVIGLARTKPNTVEEFRAIDRAKTIIFVNNSSALFKKEVALQAGGFEEHLPAAQDTELWDRMANYGPLVIIPEPLVQYRFHGESISAKKFFTQRMLHDYILQRNRANRDGKSLSLESFLTDYHHQPVFTRLFRHMNNRGRYYYRNAGVLLAQKRYIMASLSLAVSLICSPGFFIARVRNRLAPRRHVKQSML
jgi:glycosyltransferase involved in cell wall biosynthesis